LRVLFFLVVFCLAIVFLVDISDVLAGLEGISLKVFVLASLLYLAFYLINAKVLVLLLGVMGYQVALSGCFGVNQFSSLFSYVAPFRAGQYAVKAVLMRSLFAVSFSASAVVFLVASLFSICASIALFLLSAFFLKNSYFWDKYSELFLFFAFLLALVSVGVWFVGRALGVHEKVRGVVRVLSGFSVGLVSLCVVLLLLQVFISALITVVFLEGIGVQVDLMTAIFLSAVGNMTLLVSITPGNLGAKELTFVGMGMLLG